MIDSHPSNGTILEIVNVHKAFRGLVALNDVSLRVGAGQIKGLIGPNGAGKTTLFNLIAGLALPTSGDIRFRGQSLVGLPSYQIAHLGICRTFQNVQIFSGMTVLENILVGCHRHMRTGMLDAAIRSRKMHVEEEAARARAMELLERIGLAAWADAPAESLPFGLQRILEIGRALAASPKMLLLDEPASGLNALEKQQLADLIRKIREDGMTIFLVEHDMDLVMGLADDIAVLDYGTLIAQGSPEIVQKNPRVIAAYLGVANEGLHVA